MPPSWSERVYRRLTGLYSTQMRRDQEEELIETFRDAHRVAKESRGWFGVLLLWIFTLIDFIISLVADRFKPRNVSGNQRSRGNGMDNLIADLRYALRGLIRTPGFTLVVILTIGAGVGANTSVFSLVNEIHFRPLSIQNQERAVRIFTSDFSSGLFGTSSYPDIVNFRDEVSAFADVAAFGSPSATNVVRGTETARLNGLLVSPNFFSVLGVGAALGRVLSEADQQPDMEQQVLVLAYDTWRDRFGGDPGVIGTSVRVNGTPMTVIGVAEQGFRGIQLGSTTDYWFPIRNFVTVFPSMARFPVFEARGARWLNAVGALAEGVTLARASAEVNALMARLAEEFPRSNMGTLASPDQPRPITVVAARDAAFGAGNGDDISQASILISLVVGLVLLIACANVANLLIARAHRRQQETAIRLALGSSRRRLVQLHLLESMLLGVAGGATGLLIALSTQQAIITGGLSSMVVGQQTVSPHIMDPRVLLFTLTISVATSLVFGMLPAAAALRPNLIPTLKDGTPTNLGRAKFRVRDGLVALQIAGSITLLVAAGLVLRSTSSLFRTDVGFDVDGVALATVSPGMEQLDEDRGTQFYDALIERVRALPGVAAAGYGAVIPLQAYGRTSVGIEGYTPQPDEDAEINFNLVSPGFFAALGIPVTRGRPFADRDDGSATPVAVVNEAFVNRYWPNVDPIGRTLSGAGQADPIEVIGVVPTGKYRALREDPLPYMYFPVAQNYQNALTLAVRTTGDPAAIIPTIRAATREAHPTVPTFAETTLRDHFGTAFARERSATMLTGSLGALALFIAAVGLYGVTTYAVAQRAKEFGIRIALGARRKQVFGMVLRSGLKTTAVGFGLGLVGAISISQLMSTLIVDVSATDPMTLAAVGAILFFIALVASAVPAHRATRLDPVRTLRQE